MIILGIDTTGELSSSAVLTEDGKIYERHSDDRMNHLRDLIPMIRDTLGDAGVSLGDIGTIAVSAGPGSFTGIRIGMATAKGLALAQGLPLAGVPVLPGFAAGSPEGTLVCSMLDARRGRVYAGAYTRAEGTEAEGIRGIREIIPQGIYPAGEFVEKCLGMAADLSEIKSVEFFGNGVDRYSEEIASRLALGQADDDKAEEYGDYAARKRSYTVSFAPPERRYQSAAQTALAGRDMEPCHYSRAEAVYLGRTEAEKKLEAHELGVKKSKKTEEEEIMELPPEDEKITYRRATAEDAAAFAELDGTCFAKGWSENSFVDELEADSCFVAAENEAGRVIGYGGVTYVAGEGEINRIAVDRMYRMRGIAGSILKICMEDAGSRGVADITLEVRESNRSAIVLYKSFGFEVEGRRKNYYRETKENALIMWKRGSGDSDSPAEQAGSEKGKAGEE